MESKQKKAYLKLYERVGNQIGVQMHKSIKEREEEISEEYAKMQDMEAEELEMKRLREAKELG